jgi:hypothetical protein
MIVFKKSLNPLIPAHNQKAPTIAGATTPGTLPPSWAGCYSEPGGMAGLCERDAKVY